MPSDGDLISLYSTRILALAAEIPYHERLSAPDATIKKRSPLCGSTVTVDICVKDGTVTGFGQDVKACALGQAAASVIGRAIIGSSEEQLRSAQVALKSMLKSKGPAPEYPFDGLDVLRPAAEFKNRHASIMLCLDASIEALETARNAQTA
jgi:NifU-like protein involved in Fe-S cluster formation